MAESNGTETKPSGLLVWLTTIRGIITAIATLLTSIAGLYTAGVFKNHQNHPLDAPKVETIQVPVNSTPSHAQLNSKDQKSVLLEHKGSEKQISSDRSIRVHCSQQSKSHQSIREPKNSNSTHPLCHP